MLKTSLDTTKTGYHLQDPEIAGILYKEGIRKLKIKYQKLDIKDLKRWDI